MIFQNAFLLLIIGLTDSAATNAGAGADQTVRRRGLAWRDDLPWNDLTAKLSPSASLIDTNPADYLDQCTAELEKPLSERTMHAMIDQPSGLCMTHLFCAFEGCNPNPDRSNTTVADRFGDTIPTSILAALITGQDALYSTLDSKIKSWVDDMNNTVYNLPSKVLFPVVASDVVAAVSFAKEHGIELSVKNSGHNYVGASTKKDTLHINMNKYTHYAPTGVSDCDAATIDQDLLSDQPCRLSLAKGKTAVLRVGGGENWDKTYRAVQAANDNHADGYTYHVVGGAAGTVSPMGWTFQGGLSGTTAGRIWGFGVDQVLQIEMVLPNGQHVMFGPTEWEQLEGNDVPATTSVSGLCRTNREEIDEDKWEWAECTDNINFDDLWFAVRGGGGGTWGVILSLHYQLHEYLPLERLLMVPFVPSDYENLDPSQLQILDQAYQTYEIKFLLDPESVNATEEQANACGWAARDIRFSCYGEGSAQVFDATWRRYLSSIGQSLVNTGIPLSVIEAAVNCTECSDIEYFKDYASSRLFPEGHPYAGQADDDEVYISSTTEFVANVIIPKKWVLENIEKAVELFPPNPASYRAFAGRNAKATSDQANSLSQAHRDGAYMFIMSPVVDLAGLFPVIDDSFFTDLFPEMFDTTTDDFPGFIGSNHAGPNTRGPLKSDWTKACPLEWTEEERDEKCISLQEAIYGTKTLERLEAIKEAVDPNYMFDCYGCIGNNRVPTPQKEEPDSFSSAMTSATGTIFFGVQLLFIGTMASLL